MSQFERFNSLAFLRSRARTASSRAANDAGRAVTRKTMNPLTALLGTVVFACAAAGAGAQEVVKIYQDPAFRQTVRTILVVGAHADRNVRGMFENSVARALRAAGANGDSSLARMGCAEELTADTLTAAASRVGADAVMITRVLRADAPHPAASTTLAESMYAYSDAEDPLAVISTDSVIVRTDLYLVTGQQRVWGVVSTQFDKSNLFGIIDGVASGLTAQLRADRLIR